MTDPEGALEVLADMAAIGVKLSIDDFGTGYSSMAYLQRMPVHQLKIDRTFIAGLEERGRDAVIVQSSIDLARNRQLTVVAEGVETVPVWGRLEELGCDTIQGFLLSPPLAADALVGWLRQWQERGAPLPHHHPAAAGPAAGYWAET